METKEKGARETSGQEAAGMPRGLDLVRPEPDLAWADELLAFSLERFVILVAGGARSRAMHPVEWRVAPSPSRHQYSLHVTRPRRFLHATAFPMPTLMRSVMVRYAGHPEGVPVPVTPIQLPGTPEGLAEGGKVTAPDERKLAPIPLEDEWTLARARLIVPFALRGHLLLAARGETPTPCYEVRWSTRLPGTYVLRCRQTSKNCVEVLSPYMAAEAFQAEPIPEAVRVVHADRPEGELLRVLPLEKIVHVELGDASPPR